jgi:hypothetical protein
MSADGNRRTPVSPAEYILDNFEPSDRVAILVLNRNSRETIQRITSAQKAASPEFQAWLRYKNVGGADIYIGMNPLRQDSWTRTKEDVKSIRHMYLDLDQNGPETLALLENSTSVPTPNYVVNSSPSKFQVVWRVEGLQLDEAERLLSALAREFAGDPAATDVTRVLRLPGFANKKYGTDFRVEAHRESVEVYQPRDFRLEIDSQNSPRDNYGDHVQRAPSSRTKISQSERDWAYVKSALRNGADPEELIAQLARSRGTDKPNPQYYARLTVSKALADLEAPSVSDTGPPMTDITDRDCHH